MFPEFSARFDTNFAQVGREQSTVFNLLMRATHKSWPYRGVTSAFCVPHLPGRVFVEAASVLEVVGITHLPIPRACRQVKSVPSSQIMQTLFIPQQRRFQLREQGWIRLKRSSMIRAKYQNDVVPILSVSRPNLVDILLTPRELEKSDSPNVKKRKKRSRPSQALLPQWKVESMLRKGATSNDTGLVFFEDSIWTTDGFQIVRGLDAESFFPDHDTTPPYRCVSIFSKSTLVHQFTIDATYQRIFQQLIKIGDMVLFTKGELQGQEGIVQSIDSEAVTVDVPAHGQLLETSASYVRRCFAVGDYVRVVVGERRGYRGWVVRTWDSHVWITGPRLDDDDIAVPQDIVELLRAKRSYNPEGNRGYDVLAQEDEEREIMREIPCANLRHKAVVVAGRSHYKGVRGTVKNTHYDGRVDVELWLIPLRLVTLLVEEVEIW